MFIYAFTNENNEVVQAIKGSLNAEQQAIFLRDYEKLFGATSIIEVDESVSVWIGGTYDPSSGVFTPPPSPEPEPEIVEETMNDDAPIE